MFHAVREGEGELFRPSADSYLLRLLLLLLLLLRFLLLLLLFYKESERVALNSVWP